MPGLLGLYYTKKEIDALIATVTARQVQQVIFTSNGTFTKATYPWAKYAKIHVVGGGGGGAGAVAVTTAQASVGSPGGAGGYAEKIIALSSLGANETVTVGIAGAAGASNGNGGAGGSSSFGAHAVATGGVGGTHNGQAATTAGLIAVRGASGVGTVGDLLIGGEDRVNYYVDPNFDGSYVNGAKSQLGTGGQSRTNNTGLAPTNGYGGGGGGAYTVSTGAVARAGGAGKAGIVIVELFG